MAILGREAILQADDLAKELVSVPEWGGEVYVKTMSGAERDRFEALITAQRKGKVVMKLENLRAKLISMTVCDENGKLLFTEEDVEALANKSGAALTRIMAAAQKLNAITPADVEELAEGLKQDPFDDSPSG